MDWEEILKKFQALYDAAEPKASAEYTAMDTVMVKMSDGVSLKTEIFNTSKPTGAVILQRACYPHIAEMLYMQAREYTKRGFTFVIQWCRGINGSEGTWEPNIYDRQDGLDTLNWLCEQEWCDRIGYMGDSYLAYTGWCMLDSVPDKVKTMYLGVYGCDRHTSAYKDGLFRQDILTAWAKDNAGVKIEADYLESAKYRPQVEVDEKMWGVRLNWYRDWITHTDRSDEYWKEGLWGALKEVPRKVKIPVFVKEGWYDHHLGSAMVTYRNLSKEALATSTLKIGPWNHSYMNATVHQKTDNLGEDRISSPMGWFAKILLDGETPKQKASLYMIGRDEWLEFDKFPENLPVKRFALNGNKEEAYEKAAGGLGLESAGAEGKSEFTYDPENPVMSHGAESLFNTQKEVGSLPQPEVGYRDDVISFVSEPLSEDIDILGQINVKLFVSSDAEDTAFTAKLMEVFPDGTAVNIRGTITTLAYRNDSDKRLTYTPGKVEEINLKMWDVAWEAKKGSRLRLDISSSDFPQYAVHPNKPGVWSTHATTQKANQTVYFGGKYDSCIELPVLK